MSIVARNNLSSKLKNSASEIGYYSYTKRCVSYRKPAAQIAHLVFADTQPMLKKPKEQFFTNAQKETEERK